MLLIKSTSIPSPPVFVISHSTISSHSQVSSSLKKYLWSPLILPACAQVEGHLLELRLLFPAENQTLPVHTAIHYQHLLS